MNLIDIWAKIAEMHEARADRLAAALLSFDPKTLANGKLCWCLQWPDVKPEDWSCTNDAWCQSLRDVLAK